MSGDDTYAPKSPDLSSFNSGPTPPAEPYEPAETQLFSSQQTQPNFSHPQSSLGGHSFSLGSRQPQFQEPQGRHDQLSKPPQTLTSARPTDNWSTTSQGFGGTVGVGASSGAQHEYYPPRAASFSATSYSPPSTGYAAPQVPQQQPAFYQPPYRGAFQQYQYQPQTYTQPSPYPPHQFQHQPYQPTNDFLAAQVQSQQPDDMPPRRAAAAAAAAAVAAQSAPDDAGGDESVSPVPPEVPATSASAIQAATVKTKFPTARIKRIMQADEEVGKVAQQTPIAVGKALELFMVALVTKSAEVARQRNSKRVSAQMLKQVVEGDDQWDFLRDIVGKVEGEEKAGRGSTASQSGQGKVKGETSDTDEDMGVAATGEATSAVKKKRGGGRKKKVQ
ncbi:uncharacterized protein C8A04DRAFT_37096 [Dichotomopilus funicola]|uniref:NCT transcriptional regulatory complex subunit A n=1 Tax=Dichotomopilus funicola TaxID=1934379 RepID=A0AAN6V4D3_9PEZI|nr:hypothetical protein C8A04DRAFT_37096 [Dichotomopilus funicola]